MFDPLIDLIESQDLYNVLNEALEYANITDPYYLYLLDCRPRADYNESHIIYAKNIKRNEDNSGGYRLLYESELHSRNLIVVYDGNTSSLDANSPAVECAKFLADNGSKYSVKILKGGYETFSKYYPFLRTQQILYLPRELDQVKTYPSEVIPGLLYLGTKKQALEAHVKKDLKLRSYVDCTTSSDYFSFKDEKSIDYIRAPVEDGPDESLEPYIDQLCNFIDTNVKNRKQPCFVFSDLGISRAAAVLIAYLVYSQKISTKNAFDRVNKCRKIQPQLNFLNQIAKHFANEQHDIED